MNVQKKLVVLSMILIIFLAACSNNSNDSTASTAPSPTNTEAKTSPVPADLNFELDVMTWFYDETRQNLMKETIAKFNEKYPNVKVNHNANENYAQAYKLAFDSGAGPELVYLDDLNQQILEKNNNLLDITEEVKQMGWMDKLMPGTIEYNNARHPGQYFSVGFIDYPRTLFYNKEIMDKLGLSAPQNLDELIAQFATIKKAGFIPLEASSTHMLWLIFSIVLNSVPAEDIDKWYYLVETTPAFEKAYIDALVTVENWVKNGYFRDEITTIKSADVVTLYGRNETVFLLSGNSTANKIKDYPFPIGVTVFPNKDVNLPKTLVSAIDGSWALNGDIDPMKKQASLDFIDTFMNPDIAQKWLEAGFSVTVNFDKTKVEMSPLMSETFKATENTRVGYFMDNAVPGILDLMIQLNQRLQVGDITGKEYWELMNNKYIELVAENK